MKILFNTISLKTIFLFFLLLSFSKAEIIDKIKIDGNERISDETIIMFSSVKINDDIDDNTLNLIIKNLYESSFFEDISVKFENNILVISLKENPIIQNMEYEGIPNKYKERIQNKLNLKARSSFNEILIKKDKDIITISLQDLGYYFSNIEIFVEQLSDNKVNIKYVVDLGEKGKIKNITFLGNKIFKDKKLKSLIISEEYKFWKFISGKKFLNKNIISLDTRLLKNFYLNKGFFNIEINSSFAKLVSKNEFELIFNINPGKKFSFNELSLKLPADFDVNNFEDLLNLFSELNGETYSLNKVKKILEQIDIVTISDQFEAVTASVVETIIDDKINLSFVIEETEKSFVERINILGNNVTRETVIRNQLVVDEGDPFNEILANKSINNLKSLNFFRNVKSEVIDGTTSDQKIINIIVEEKPTGEISAGAGFGTSGGTISLGVKENNYLGKGLTLNSNLTLNEESLKGLLSIRDPNFKNSNKSVYFSAEALEINRLATFGYKTNKTGFSLGTDFEYYDNFRVGFGSSNFYEKIDTDSTASARQKLQDGNYWDSFVNFNFDYDLRNQKFQTTQGFRSRYFLDLPVISDTSTLTNTYNYKYFTELYENNVSAFGIYLKSSSSLTNNDIKLSERNFIPSSRLRGFEKGKIGPKDGDDFIGGNYAASINFSTTVPQILENSEDIDFLFFFDAANVWGVDYFRGDDEGSEIRSSIGIALDWLTPIGPLSFSLAESITKSNSDITESFRFNLGTTF